MWRGLIILTVFGRNPGIREIGNPGLAGIWPGSRDSGSRNPDLAGIGRIHPDAPSIGDFGVWWQR
jgi:hypothetical protein